MNPISPRMKRGIPRLDHDPSLNMKFKLALHGRGRARLHWYNDSHKRVNGGGECPRLGNSGEAEASMRRFRCSATWAARSEPPYFLPSVLTAIPRKWRSN